MGKIIETIKNFRKLDQQEIKKVERPDLSDYLNVLYREIYNDGVLSEERKNSKSYKEAKSIISENFSDLDANILEYIAMLKFFHPESKIEFAKDDINVKLNCSLGNDKYKTVVWNINGRIIEQKNYDLSVNEQEKN